MNLPMVSVLQCLVLGVHELRSFWMKLMGRCTPGMHQEGTAATIGASVAGITLEVIQSKEHLKCFFFFRDVISSAPTVSLCLFSPVVYNTCQHRHSH